MHETPQYIKTADDVNICFDYWPGNHQRLIVVAHGFFNSRKGRLIQTLGKFLAQNYDVILIDFRGHGDSHGIFSWTSKEFLDLEAVLSLARPRYKKIGVVGFSLGAATSIITAARCELIDSLVSVSAPSQLSKIEYHFWDLNFENDIVYNLIQEGRIGKGVRPGAFWFKKEKPIEAILKVKVPTLFLHGDKDWIIRSWHSEELYKHSKSYKKIHILKKGPHAEYLIRKNKEEMFKLIEDWFKETLGSPE